RQVLGGFVELQVSGARLHDQSGQMLPPGAAEHSPDAWQASASAMAWGSVRGFRMDALLDWGVDAPDGDKSAHGMLAELAVRSPSLRDVLWTRGELGQREEPTGTVSSPWLFGTVGYERVVLA